MNQFTESADSPPEQSATAELTIENLHDDVRHVADWLESAGLNVVEVVDTLDAMGML